jgi:hypothetical protein
MTGAAFVSIVDWHQRDAYDGAFRERMERERDAAMREAERIAHAETFVRIIDWHRRDAEMRIVQAMEDRRRHEARHHAEMRERARAREVAALRARGRMPPDARDGVPAWVILGILWNESSSTMDASGTIRVGAALSVRRAAIGPFQMQYAAFCDVATAADRARGYRSIASDYDFAHAMARKYLLWLHRNNRGDWDQTIAEYRFGPGSTVQEAARYVANARREGMRRASRLGVH